MAEDNEVNWCHRVSNSKGAYRIISHYSCLGSHNRLLIQEEGRLVVDNNERMKEREQGVMSSVSVCTSYTSGQVVVHWLLSSR